MEQILKDRDENQHYQSLFKQLAVNQRWSSEQTDKYMELTMGELPDEIESMEQTLIDQIDSDVNKKAIEQSNRRRSRS